MRAPLPSAPPAPPVARGANDATPFRCSTHLVTAATVSTPARLTSHRHPYLDTLHT